jgi:hypothetical protein
MSYTSIMGAKQSTTITNVDEVKDDIPSSTDYVCDSSGITPVMIQDQHPIDISGVRLVPIVDTAGCGCIGCGIHACSEGQLQGSRPEEVLQNMRTETIVKLDVVSTHLPARVATEGREPKDDRRESVGRCHCGNQCMCVYPCNCESTKSQCMCVPPCECKPTKTPVKSSWSVPHIFTKTTDLEKRLDDIEVRFNKLKESLNNNDKRIDTLETISKQMDVVSQGSVEDIHTYFDGRLKEVQSNMTEYVPLSAIPYCTRCKTIVLNGQVCDCGLIVQ